MKKYLILLLLFFACDSCLESPEAKFEKDGVTFISPRGLKITDEENIDNEGYLISIEKDGFDSSSLIIISWINGELDLDNWININVDEMKNNIIYKNSNLVFRELQKDKYNYLDTNSMKYTSDLLGVKHEGIIHFFYKKGKTFSISIEEAIEDKAKNKKGLKLIEQSFKIE